MIVMLGFALETNHANAVDMMVVTRGPTEGWNAYPFTQAGEFRYQQVYAASLFGDIGPVRINAIRFSSDISGTYAAGINLRLNQTQVAVGALDPNLDANINGSLTTVLQNPNFSQSVIGGDLTYRLIFDVSAASFIYNPSSGENLLMDIIVTDGSNSGMAFARSGDTGKTSRAWTGSAWTGSADRLGLRTAIEFTTVPEPSQILMGFAAIVFLIAVKKWPLLSA